MAKKKDNDLSNYYVIKFEKYIDLLTDIEKKYHILADLLHEEILKTLPEFWDTTPVVCLATCFATVADIRSFLDEKVNNVSEQEVKLAQKNNIKDVLFTKQDLQVMNMLLLAEEELESRLLIEHKISLIAH